MRGLYLQWKSGFFGKLLLFVNLGGWCQGVPNSTWRFSKDSLGCVGHFFFQVWELKIIFFFGRQESWISPPSLARALTTFSLLQLRRVNPEISPKYWTCSTSCRTSLWVTSCGVQSFVLCPRIFLHWPTARASRVIVRCSAVFGATWLPHACSLMWAIIVFFRRATLARINPKGGHVSAPLHTGGRVVLADHHKKDLGHRQAWVSRPNSAVKNTSIVLLVGEIVN